MIRTGSVFVLALLGACTTVGPDYHRPDVGVPVAYQSGGPWREGQPADAVIREDWWTLFGDPVLDELQQRAQTGSPKLQAAAARLEQARASLGIADAARLPILEFAPDIARYGVSGNRPDQPEKVPGNRDYDVSRFRVPLYASYELDLWGRVRRATESALAQLEASRANYQTLQLTLQGDVAQTYFQLRALDEQSRLAKAGVDIRRRARDLVAARRRGGIASELDVTRIESELATNEAEVLSVQRRRSEVERALGVLVGATPEAFSLPDAPMHATVPMVPVGLPSDLLERRPDVAAAERLLAARNAEIGVARAGMFPAIRLTAALGFESSELTDLLKTESLIWGLAGSLAQPIFDGGRNRGRVERAKAAYAENLADYRQRLLVALSEVENALTALRLIGEQSDVQARALANADKAAGLASLRYKAGLVAVLEVIDAQRTKLAAEREMVQLRTQRLAAGVALVKALGGGWKPGVAAPATADAAPVPRT